MAKSISQQIIEAVQARAESILVSGGYNSNAGQRVYWARPGIEPALLPCVVIWPGAETQTERDVVSRGAQYVLEIKVEALADADLDATGTHAEELLADLREAIFGPADDTLGGLAAGLSDAGAERIPRADGSLIEGASITLTVEYYGQHGDPYTSG